MNIFFFFYYQPIPDLDVGTRKKSSLYAEEVFFKHPFSVVSFNQAEFKLS